MIEAFPSAVHNQQSVCIPDSVIDALVRALGNSILGNDNDDLL